MILPVPVAPSPLPQNAEVLRILPLSDLHLPKPSAPIILNNRPLLERADYVVFLGDMVRAYGTDGEYEEVHAFVSGLKRPFTAISGNHEWYFEEFDEDSGLYGSVWAEGAPDGQRAHIEKFLQFWHLNSLWRAFSSPLGHFVFLSLNAVGVNKQESLDDEQLEFLRQEVQRAGDKPLFVFCHCPLMLDTCLDMVYYEEERTGCIEPQGELKQALLTREAPTFWMSGHVHLHPDHYLFPPYKVGGNCFQIHCPDSWGYGRWLREQVLPEYYEGPFSRLLEIDAEGVTFVTHDHRTGHDRESYRVTY